jgi:hypothetical protein
MQNSFPAAGRWSVTVGRATTFAFQDAFELIELRVFRQ